MPNGTARGSACVRAGRSLANDADGCVGGAVLSKKVAGARRSGQAISVIRPYPSYDQPSQRHDRAGAQVLTAAATASCMAAGEEPGVAGRCRAARLAGRDQSRPVAGHRDVPATGPLFLLPATAGGH